MTAALRTAAPAPLRAKDDFRWSEVLLSLLSWLVVSALTVFWTVPMFFVFLVHRWVDPQRRLLHLFASQWGRGLVAMPGGHVQVFGLENLPKSRPVVLMANHLSYADVPVLFNLRHQFKWMADAPLFAIPFFGWAMRMAGYIPVQRGNARAGIRALQQAKRYLAQGISIFVFPEGTRSHTGAFGRFQTGGFRLAAETGVPIVPVVVVGTRQLLPRGTWIFHLNVRLQIHILPPIDPEGMKGARGAHHLAHWVRGEMVRVYRQYLRNCR